MISISVIIPTYNRSDVVCFAIESVLAQTYPAAEIIVIDDGSKDDTPQVLARYGSKIRPIIQKNTGQSGARNAGILAAKSEWIAFLDDDDEYTHDRLAIAVEGIRRFPLVEVHATNTAIVSSGTPDLDLFKLRGLPATEWMQEARPLARVLNGCCFVQSLVVKRSTFDDVGLFRPMFYEDMDLFVRLVSKTPWVVDSRTSLRLIRRENTTATSDEWRARPVKRCEALVGIHRDALLIPGLTAREIHQVRRGLGTYLFELGAALAHDGDNKTSREKFAESFRTFTTVRSRAKAVAALLFGRPFLSLLQKLSRRKKGVVR